MLANINKLNRAMEGVIAVSYDRKGGGREEERDADVGRLAMSSARSRRCGASLRM